MAVQYGGSICGYQMSSIYNWNNAMMVVEYGSNFVVMMTSIHIWTELVG